MENIHPSYHTQSRFDRDPPASTWLSKDAGLVEVDSQSAPYLQDSSQAKKSVDRKIKCDRALPTCANCRYKDVQCQGYGMRLSWPRSGDKRRAVELKSTAKQKKHILAALYQHSLFLNMTSWDVEKFYELSEAKSTRKNLSPF